MLHALKLPRHFIGMRHQQHRHILIAAHASQQVDHLLLMRRINIRRRLIRQQQTWAGSRAPAPQPLAAVRPPKELPVCA